MIGMNNNILEINLGEADDPFTDIPIPDEILEEYLGGRGLGIKMFTDRHNEDLNPLSAENELIFTIGPFTGTSVPTNGRFSLVTKSPLTDGIFYSNSGGFFGVYMKKCGYDGLIFGGISEKPVYLLLDGDKRSLKSAEELWGLNTEETKSKLHEIEGKSCRILMIGPAGENMVKFAAVMNDAERAFGRGGVGAVMGSKKLKAIVVKNGRIRTEIKDPDRLKKLVKSAQDKIKVAPITRSALPRFGTSGLVNIINELGMFPIKNFQRGYDEKSEQVSGEAIRKNIFQKDEGCFACPIRCGRKTGTDDMDGKGPEYESVWALGPNLGIFELNQVAEANYLCNQLGLDTISCGGTIACAMELEQKGLLKSETLKFGNTQELHKIIRKIASRKDFGDELAEGSARLAQKYNSPETAIHVKKMELPAYDPRGAMGHALGYATSNRGGDHLTGYLAAMEIFAAPKRINRFNVGGKSDLLVLKQNSKVVEDSVGVCAFAGWALGLDFYARFLTAITGIEYSVANLIQRGNKIYNMERLYNLKAGIERDQDTLPPRFTDEPLEEGFSKDKTVPIETMLEEYYRVRKWDEQGVPKEELLTELHLKSGGE